MPLTASAYDEQLGITTFSCYFQKAFPKIIGRATRKRFDFTKNTPLFKHVYCKHNSVKSIRLQSILVISTAKYQVSQEPVRMLLFIMDQFSRAINPVIT